MPKPSQTGREKGQLNLSPMFPASPPAYHKTSLFVHFQCENVFRKEENLKQLKMNTLTDDSVLIHSFHKCTSI